MSRLARFLLLAAAATLPLRGVEPAATTPRPLPFEDVLRSAAERAPLAAASAARRDASDASAAKARRLPNPEATLRVENWRRGTEANPYDAQTDLDVVAELSQPLPVFGTWSSRRDEAAAMSRAARATSRGELEAIVLEAARLYLGAVRGRDLVAALAESRDALGTMVATMEKRVAEGWSAEGDLLKLRAENARSEALLARATLELGDSAARLAALLGEESPVDPARFVMPLVPALPEGEPEDLGRTAAATRPAVLEARERLEAARATLRLEKALRAPEPSLTAGYKRTGGLDTALAGISFPLPVFDTNATGVARAEAEVRAAEAVLPVRRARGRRRHRCTRPRRANARHPRRGRPHGPSRLRPRRPRRRPRLVPRGGLGGPSPRRRRARHRRGRAGDARPGRRRPPRLPRRPPRPRTGGRPVSSHPEMPGPGVPEPEGFWKRHQRHMPRRLPRVLLAAGLLLVPAVVVVRIFTAKPVEETAPVAAPTDAVTLGAKSSPSPASRSPRRRA